MKLTVQMESGSGNGDNEVERTMLRLLDQLDRFEASNKIKVVFSLYSCTILKKRHYCPMNDLDEFALITSYVFFHIHIYTTSWSC